MGQALYRKYRPKTFDDILGQDNIINILKNQVKNNKVAHAYIFSGSRGTGKTSCAKIFSRAVNCLNPKDGNPCNVCKNCRSIYEESTVDVIEMDAASNRRIEDIRQLRDKVVYPPTNIKYKVYIIDEAHMITNEGFNALLKIMEEPPKHLIFVLATTEIDKIPDTILSRTQRFEFKRISRSDIVKNIENILVKEDKELEEQAINAIASSSNGAMRDALSTLDQVLAINKEKVSLEDVNNLLGMYSLESKIAYIQAIFSFDLTSAMKIIDEEMSSGKDPHYFVQDVLNLLRDILLTKIKGENNIVNMDKSLYSKYKDAIEEESLDKISNSMQILLDYERLIKTTDNSRMLLELATIRLCDYRPREDLIGQIKSLEIRLDKIEKLIKGNNFEKLDEKSFQPVNKKITRDEINLKDGALEEIEKKIDEKDGKENKSLNETNEKKEDIKEYDESPESVREIILREYPNTSILFNEVRKEEYKKGKYIYHLTTVGMNASLAMNFFIRQAEISLSKKLSKDVIIEFIEYKENKKSSKEKINVVSKEEKLREILPDEILEVIK